MYKRIANSLKKHAKLSILAIVLISLILIANNVTGVSDVVDKNSDIKSIEFVKDFDNPARQPIQSDIVLQIPDVTRDITGTIFHVPLNKRLVIEFVSAEVSILGNEKFVMQIQTKLGGSVSNHFMMPNLIGTFPPNDIFEVSQQTRLYADPDTDVLIKIHRNAGGGIGDIESSISGYLVDIP